ncbi:FAD/FMN-containing dehydrogenase [Bacillus pakistanensis]|uniref:FAD/FMN-containing dehydrogenase n=2 Tax=Rossellomorea pakistanensis TaxID=992288 RepID=A0ABS2NGK5_9BACI|nr:FAD/FMN-containing dehydrogenase [Bacillus pakistanensis]
MKLKKKKTVRNKLLILICFVSSYLLIMTVSFNDRLTRTEISDVGNLMPVKIKEAVTGKEEKTFEQTLKEASEKNLSVSIAGKMHSQGGHTYYPNGIVLDMKSYNRILQIDKEEKTVTVQSGATWDDIQRAVNPYGLAVKVMQSQNIFTIGGSLSVNAHGRDIRHGSLIETVNSFRLMKADGEIINVSRKENSQYFPLVIGGYGLFGIILDVELQLTDDELYEVRTTSLSYKEYSDFFTEKVMADKKVKMHLARISTAPDSFLKDMYITDWVLANQEAYTSHSQLKEERGTFLMKFLLGLSRNFDWGKKLFWDLQEGYFQRQDGELMTRNNVMRSESKFLEYESESDTDILQEYFVPIDEFESYMDDLRHVLLDEDLNLMNITIRYVEENQEAVLSYSKEDMFALVLLINQGLTEKDKEETGKIIREMIDVTLDHNGSYYLPYYSYPTNDQMKRAYPRKEEFFQKKRNLDPEERFRNMFYEGYGE